MDDSFSEPHYRVISATLGLHSVALHVDVLTFGGTISLVSIQSTIIFVNLSR
jgi:hypothetical protein